MQLEPTTTTTLAMKRPLTEHRARAQRYGHNRYETQIHKNSVTTQGHDLQSTIKRHQPQNAIQGHEQENTTQRHETQNTIQGHKQENTRQRHETQSTIKAHEPQRKFPRHEPLNTIKKHEPHETSQTHKELNTTKEHNQLHLDQQQHDDNSTADIALHHLASSHPTHSKLDTQKSCEVIETAVTGDDEIVVQWKEEDNCKESSKDSMTEEHSEKEEEDNVNVQDQIRLLEKR